MKKYILLISFFSITITCFSQKSQKIGYINMDYILKKIPEYLEAQNSLNAKVDKWKRTLDKKAREIEVMKTDLANEKAILTSDLIIEREEDITVKEEALKKLESLYFGPDGDMYIMRKKLIQPVQDQVYNAVQTIAKRKKYDFVFDKSNDLVMLYTNKKHDLSELIVKLINIDQKKQQKADKIAERKKLLDKEGLSDEQKARLAKKEELKQKRKADREAKYSKIEAKRQKMIQEREAKRKLLLEKREALRKKREKINKQKEDNGK